MKKQQSRRLSAIMFTDIVGYTALMQKDENKAAQVRNFHRVVFQDTHKQFDGEILQYFGDGTLSVFRSCLHAVECAIAIQKQMKNDQVPLRIGLHIGDIVFDGTDIYGDGVNLASRIESLGVPGAIFLSEQLNNELKNHPHISTSSLGHFEFKNIAEAVEVYAVTNEGVRIPERSELQGKLKKQDKSVAVLPFVNRSSNEEHDYFCDGMTEEIINALTKVIGLKVTSRTSSFFFKNKKIPLPQIGRELNVSTILEGSIRLAGNKVRITAQLIDVKQDFHFWSETFDRSLDDIFALQDEISLLIADKLREHIGHLEIADQLVEVPQISVKAYKQYLKSRYHILKMNKADILKGMTILEIVIQDHPNFAQAYLGMNLAYTLMGTIGIQPAEEAFTKGHAFLQKAIELNDQLPDCQLQLAWIAFLQKWDLPAAYEHLNKALEIRPLVDYYQSMAATLVAEKKCTAALHYIETALQLDPFSEINYHLKGFIFYVQEDYKKAVTSFKKSIELKPDAMVSKSYLGQSFLLMGEIQKGLNYFENLPDDKSGDLLKPGGLALAYATTGNIEKLRPAIVKLESLLHSEVMERAMYFLIMCYTRMKEFDKAIQMIEQGINYRLPMMVYLNVEPLLQPLYSNSRFQELMKQIIGEQVTTEIPKRKYKQTLFDVDQLATYKKALEELMIVQKPYLDPNLSLRSLAGLINLPPNHLSQLLNEGFDKNFAEFINSFRLETFKEKAADPANHHLTILAIAFESGFNSKTVFNTYFKKAMGQTPSAYWKKVSSISK